MIWCNYSDVRSYLQLRSRLSIGEIFSFCSNNSQYNKPTFLFVNREEYAILYFNFPFIFILSFFLGMFIASLALVSAGVVENCRMDVPRSWNNSIGKVVVVGRDISILYQIPQFGLMGISEVFVMITGECLHLQNAFHMYHPFVVSLF